MSIDVLHANVEYFGSQAIGILIVLVSSAGAAGAGVEYVENACVQLSGT